MSYSSTFSSSTSYSSRLSRCITRRRPHRHPLIGIVLVTSYCTTSRRYSYTLSAALTLSQSSLSNSSRRALLAIILAVSYSLSSSPPVLIDIVLVTLYCTTSRCLYHSESYANDVTKFTVILVASYSPSYSPRPSRYRPRRWCPHRHPPHRRRAHRVVSYLPTFLSFFLTRGAMLHASKQHYYM
jgi:hypothetical protein